MEQPLVVEIRVAKEGGVTFSEAYLASLGGERTVKLNIGYRIHTFKAAGTMKGVWKKVSGHLQVA